MDTETIKDCRTHARELERFRTDIIDLQNEIDRQTQSIRSQKHEIERLEAENQQLEVVGGVAERTGGILGAPGELGGAAVGMAAKVQITSNALKISRLEAEIASVERDITIKKQRLDNWKEIAREAEAWLRTHNCPF